MALAVVALCFAVGLTQVSALQSSVSHNRVTAFEVQVNTSNEMIAPPDDVIFEESEQHQQQHFPMTNEIGVKVLMVAGGAEYLEMVGNWVRHMEQSLPGVPFSVLTTDGDTQAVCLAARKEAQGECVLKPMDQDLIDHPCPAMWPDCNESYNAETNKHYASRFYVHRLRVFYDALVAEARGARRSVLFLDATALLQNTTCLQQLVSFPESVVVSSDVSPSQFQMQYGRSGNTGVFMFHSQPDTLAWTEKWLEITNKGYRVVNDQEGFGQLLLDQHFRWDTPENLLHCGMDFCHDATGVTEYGKTFRFLGESLWTRGNTSRQQNKCSYHPYVVEKNGLRQRFEEDGWWTPE